MATSLKKAPIRNGLRDISMDEFWKDPLIVVDALEQKLRGLPINAKKDPEFARQMKTAVELLRATGTRRYGKISVLAAMDIFQAAHYFLLLADRNPDSQDGGYDDDAAVMQQAFARHTAELREFERWLLSTQ